MESTATYTAANVFSFFFIPIFLFFRSFLWFFCDVCWLFSSTRHSTDLRSSSCTKFPSKGQLVEKRWVRHRPVDIGNKDWGTSLFRNGISRDNSTQLTPIPDVSFQIRSIFWQQTVHVFNPTFVSVLEEVTKLSLFFFFW